METKHTDTAEARNQYADYLASYDYEYDDVPPLDYEAWLATYGWEEGRVCVLARGGTPATKETNRYIVSDSRLVEIRAMFTYEGTEWQGPRVTPGVSREMLAAAIYDLLSERDEALAVSAGGAGEAT